MEWSSLLPYLPILVAGILLGYLVGARRASKSKQRAIQKLNAQSLDLLDLKASLAAASQSAATGLRKEKLLTLSLTKLAQANQTTRELSALLDRQNNRHFIELARLKLQLVEACEATDRATASARQANVRLKRLETVPLTTQTIEAPEPKSYGNGEPVTVSVVDQARPGTISDIPTTVSNRDSDRLTRLTSSNESRVRVQL